MTIALVPSPRSTDWSFPVEGMTCASCVSRVEKVLAQLPGVSSATVNLATEIVTLRSASDLQAHTITEAVQRAGYSVPQQTVTLEIDGPARRSLASGGNRRARSGRNGANDIEHIRRSAPTTMC